MSGENSRVNGYMTVQGMSFFRRQGTLTSRIPEGTRPINLLNISFLNNYNSRHFSAVKVQKITMKAL